MQHSLTVEPLPHFASHQVDSSFDAQHSSNGQPAQPLCGAFDALTGFLLLGCSFGTVSCLHLGRYGSTARRVLGRHAGRVTAACVFPWQAPEHIAAAATVVPSARTASFFATCSADATVKLWTSDAKALHTTDACLQTLRGHRAAVTSLAAVQVAQTWCLLSGSSDGQVLMWRAEAPADSREQQLSGAAMLAQLVPHMRVTEAPLYTSPHWVLSIACPMQHTEAGVEQGAFIALAQQPLQHVPISKSAVAVTQQTIAASAASTAQQQYRGSTPNSSRPLFGQPHSTLPPSRLSIDALQPAAAAAAAAQASRLALHTSCQGSSPAGALGSTANRTACSSPTSAAHTAQRLQRQGSGGSSGGGSSCVSSSCCGSLGMQSKPAAEVSEVPGTQHLSIFAVKFVLQQMAVLTLAYDGACRLHSVVEGVTKCCWRSPTGSFYVAMDVCTGPQGQVVLIGDDKGSLHLYSLTTEKLLATKQIATSRIASIISCDTTGSSSSALSSSGGVARSSSSSSSGSGSGSSRDGTCVQFAVLSEDSVGLWQLRQGFSHGIVPGGHRQGVLILQYCGKQLQLASQDLPQLPAAPTLTKSDTISSFFGLSAQQSDTQPAADTAGSSSSSGGSFGSNGGGCNSNGSGGSHAVDSAAGPMLISAGLDGKVIQWDVSGTCPAAMQSVATSAGAVEGSELTAMTYLQGAGIMATGHDNGQILLWHMDTGSHTVLGPQAHTNSVSCLTPVITVKGDEQFVSGGFDGWVCLWEPRQVRGTKPHLIARFQASGHRPSSPRLVHAQQQQQCGHKLPAAGSAPGNAHSSRPVSSSRAVSAAHGKAVGLEQHVSSAAVSAAMLGTHRCSSPLAPGARPSSSSSSGWQHVQQAGGPTRGSSASPCHDGSGNRGSCANSCADARGNSGGYGSSGSSAVDVLAALQQSPPEILVVLFDPQNQVIITGGNDGLIKVWAGAASGVLLGQHVGHTSPVNCLALDGNLLLSGSHDGSIRMWDVLPPWFSGQGHSGRPSSPTNAAAPAVGPAGTAGSAGSSSSTAEPRGASAATTTTSSSSNSRPVRSACRSAGYTRGSNTVATSSAYTVLKGHKGSVTGLAVATETGVLVSCGVDGQVLQWDYSTGQVLERYCLEGQSLLCLAVDSKQVYVGTGHGHLLTIPGTEWVVGGGESSSAILPTA